jgi:hypothetical protein
VAVNIDCRLNASVTHLLLHIGRGDAGPYQQRATCGAGPESELS